MEQGGRLLSSRRIAVGVIAALVVAMLIGVPTGVIETPWYHRMTPVLWWNYPIWAMSSVLTGVLASTYVRNPAVPVPATQGGKTFFGSLLSLFAVGCPICNKLVVMAVGVSGAMSWFAPLQPLLAAGSLALLSYAVWARRRTVTLCRVRTPTTAAGSAAGDRPPRGDVRSAAEHRSSQRGSR